MQIAVYAIGRDDDQKYLTDWQTSVADADSHIIIDSGTNPLRDATVIPWHSASWRADDALNTALALLAADVCLRVDLNERVSANWRTVIERAWHPRYSTMLHHAYQWGSHSYIGDRIHQRHQYRWRGRVHERLIWTGKDEPFAHFVPDLTIHHLGRDRSHCFVLSHLKADAEEWPNDPDIVLIYGRELFYQQCYGEAQTQLLRFVTMVPSGVRSAYAYRLLAQVDRENAATYLNMAESAYSCPSNYLALAEHYYHTQQWRLCYTCAQFAFSMQRSTPAHLPPEWGDDPRLHTSLLHQLASMAAFHLWDFEAAYGHAVEAVRRAPTNMALRQHLARMQDKIKQGSTVQTTRPVLKLIMQPIEETQAQAAQS